MFAALRRGGDYEPHGYQSHLRCPGLPGPIRPSGQPEETVSGTDLGMTKLLTEGLASIQTLQPLMLKTESSLTSISSWSPCSCLMLLRLSPGLLSHASPANTPANDQSGSEEV